MEPTPYDSQVRILLVDDDEDDFVLTRDLLSEIPDARIALDWIADADEALERICGNEYDLYLIDYRLDASTGVELIRRACERGCRAPMILLTGLGERTLDFEAMQAGAADYLEKGKLDATLLERSIRYTLQQNRHADELERRVQQRTAELEQANAALREVDRRKDEFLATLAHELRNPLVPIRNALEIMRRADERPEIVAKSRALIERQVAHLVRLVDDLLDISRISRGEIQLRKEHVLVSDVVANALESSRPLIERAGHELTVVLPPDPVAIEADPLRLAQILLNLLNNAAKYTEPGGRIELNAACEGDDLVFCVHDNGQGIPAEVLPHIFEMFIQVPRNPERVQNGLGIGLSLVRNLAELHGGTVEATSDGLGQGSKFVVHLPLGRKQTNLS